VEYLQGRVERMATVDSSSQITLPSVYDSGKMLLFPLKKETVGNPLEVVGVSPRNPVYE